jgi:hypothetical protein
MIELSWIVRQFNNLIAASSFGECLRRYPPHRYRRRLLYIFSQGENNGESGAFGEG